MNKKIVTDELLSKVLYKVSEEMVLDFEKKTDENYQFSKDFENNMRKLIKKDKLKKSGYTRKLSYMQIAAAAAIIFLILFIANPMQVRAGLGVLFEKKEVIFSDEDIISIYEHESGLYIDTKYEPGYIPEGYEEVDRNISDVFVSVKYENEQGEEIRWKQSMIADGSVIGQDKKYDELIEKEYKDGNISIYIYKNGFKGMYYEIGSSIFAIFADNLSVDEMYKIIDGMKQIEE